MSPFPMQDDIVNERGWTKFAALCLLIVFCLGTLGACYASILKVAEQRGWSGASAQLVAASACFLVILPGGWLWKVLRPKNRRAALYGLLLAALLGVSVAALVGSL